ncbi:hypothetical protein Y032_0013g2156 [Ancylostoma ceylanicum]|uniref:Uncharacterized protein n=1 Tax=Ancylostoma ceylanicum TaxID=53326 RepID=A0A016VBS0_9BILA|nr:hypothetical protein Y032_0013g2156 [Ancylostoma ceylanicum]
MNLSELEQEQGQLDKSENWNVKIRRQSERNGEDGASGPSHFSYARDGALPNMGQLVEHAFLNLARIAINTDLEIPLQLGKKTDY